MKVEICHDTFTEEMTNHLVRVWISVVVCAVTALLLEICLSQPHIVRIKLPCRIRYKIRY